MARAHRAVEHQLCQAAPARGERASVEQRDAASYIRRADVGMHRGPVFKGACFCGQHAQREVDAGGGRCGTVGHDPVATRQAGVRHTAAGQIERAALARHGALRRAAVGVQAAHACARAREQCVDFIAHVYFTGNHRAGDHQASACHGEGAIHRHAKPAAVRCLARLWVGQVVQAVQVRTQGRQPGTGDGRERKHWRGCERGGGEQLLDLLRHLLHPRRLDCIDLGQCHRAHAHAEQVENGEVLAGLRHRAVVSRDHQQRAVNAGHTGEHVVDKAFVAGHVDEAQRRCVCCGRVGVFVLQVSKAKINRHAAPFFFRQTVGINACEGLDQ